MQSYWDRFIKQRVNRRRALVGAGSFSAVAAFLAACGGDDTGDGGGDGAGGGNGGTGGQAATGLIHTPADTTESAQHGGVYKTTARFEPNNFDLYDFDATLQPFSNVVGSQLLMIKPGRLEPPRLEVQGDLAESWELSPDKMTLTIKLHPQAKWSPLSPNFHQGVPSSVANRQIDADDVVFSWERFKSTATAFGNRDLANEVAPSAPVSSLTKIDQSTIQMHMVRPYAPLYGVLARPNVGYFYILPKEGQDGAIDFLKTQIGAGPFYIDSYEPSVALRLKRNPNFELRDQFKQPFVDGVDLPFISEMAQRLAQYRAGGIFTSPTSSQVDSAEVLQLKRDFPGHLLRTVYTSYGDVHMFGHNETSPFKDVRVRQAFSMAQDRDLLIQTLLTTDILEDAGIPADLKWNSAMPCNEEGWPNGTYKGWWLDPQSPDFGENAKYYQYNPDEAKALLEAAGYPDGFEFTHMHGTTVPRSVEIINGMIAEIGMRANNRPINSAEQTSIITNAEPQGNWGDLYTSIDPTAPDPGIYLYQLYHKSGGTFQGYNPEGRALSTDGDPFVNDLIDRLNTEFDEARRIEMVFEFTRYHAKMNYRPRLAGGANTIVTSWPALQNEGVWLGDSFKREWTHEWLDQTRPPFA